MTSFLQAENVSYVYSDGTVALQNVSSSFDCGESVAVIGRNGSGKTTLAKVLAGMFRPTSGRVLVEETNYVGYTVAELGRKIGYVFQNFDYQLFSDTVENEVSFGLRNMGLPETEIQSRVSETLQSLSIEQYRNTHPRRLSSGERQAVAIASILAMQPNAVILDEPTTGQDQARTTEITNFIQRLTREGKLVIVVSHNIGHVATCCQRIVVVHDGKIVADGPTSEILANKQLLQQIHVKPTPMMQLSELLQQHGCPTTAFSIQDMAGFIKTQTRRNQT
ncbi:MAG: energy-coupling factor ABC transporter ATP-binding protein [archaeon]